MCGIVGYLGPMDPKDIIVAGLKKLEYRGYDSAGVAILDNGHVKRVRAEGKLKNLEAKLTHEKFDGHLGIGHTRWATHGVPSEKNAHPHQVAGISLVHNGIIENYLEIKEGLLKRNAYITSDTDSELVAHLISEEIATTKDLITAVQNILPKLRGAFSILVLWDQQPDRLVAFKDGPPLVVGLGKNEVFIASDVQAALEYTKNFIYLEDREIALVKSDAVKIFDREGRPLQKTPVLLNWTSELVEKKGFSHFMLKEIYEQPQAVASAVAPHIDLGTNSIRLRGVGFGNATVQELDRIDHDKDWQETQKVFRKINRISIVACGTSAYAGMVGKYLIETLAKLPVEVDIASEYRYRRPVVTTETLVLTISQSGETADTLAAIRLAKSLGATTLSICNVRSSSIDREASGHLYMNSGVEIGVASTKAFSSTLALLNCLALAIAKSRVILSEKIENEHVEALLSVPSQMEVVLSFDKYFDEAAASLRSFKGFLYMGRGVSYPIALEGALKLKELAYLHAEGYAAGEMKHGPLALIDESMAIIMIAPEDELLEKTVSNLEEAKARGGKIITIGTGDNLRLKGLSERYLPMPKGHWSTNPLLSVVPLQLLAFHLAKDLGSDVDQPRNLAKSVTVE